MRRTVPPSAEIEEQIDHLLAVGVGENPRESLSELARLGARLIIQRAVEDEFDAWLGRARYERRPDYQRGLRNYGGGLRNGFRPRRVQTAEGELEVEIPQVREAAEAFASKLFPRGTKLVRTEPLKALVIGAFVRGLSMRDVESLCEQAGLGKLSRSTASRICEELRERFEQFKRRDLPPVPKTLAVDDFRESAAARSAFASALEPIDEQQSRPALLVSSDDGCRWGPSRAAGDHAEWRAKSGARRLMSFVLSPRRASARSIR